MRVGDLVTDRKNGDKGYIIGVEKGFYDSVANLHKEQEGLNRIQVTWFTYDVPSTTFEPQAVLTVVSDS